MDPVTDANATDPALAADIDARCRLTGTFTLRSGQVADTYFDKYLFEADPALLKRVAEQMVPLLPEDTDLRPNCEWGYGTAAHVAGAFGLAAAGEAIRLALAEGA